MKRHVRMEDISDGKLYRSNDLVRTDCGGCKGCHACCQGMGESIILDPLDIHQMTKGLSVHVEQLIGTAIELTVVDGVILPAIRMKDEKEQCYFLNDEGRCTIHSFRPGICRLFPLGRYYEDGDFRYFLQTQECVYQNRTKIKISKWLGIPNLKAYEAFVLCWHDFLNAVENLIQQMPDEARKIDMYILQQFYLKPYHGDDIYTELDQRIVEAKTSLGL